LILAAISKTISLGMCPIVGPVRPGVFRRNVFLGSRVELPNTEAASFSWCEQINELAFLVPVVVMIRAA